ncbi:MAG: type II secretion system secretin GspD [Magnetococcales bacterium]|nr:type II secretion system secretin GspD [Magnetococcales bacterium]
MPSEKIIKTMWVRISWLVVFLGMWIGVVMPVAAKELTLNLRGADLTTLVETVAQATGRNFILDPQIKGKVTVISVAPMTEKDLYRMFLSILEVHGYIAVPTENGAIKIIPDTKMKSNANSREEEQPDGGEVVTRVFKLRHVGANRLVNALRPMISQNAHMAAQDEGNMLIVSDHADVIERLSMIVQRVDQPDEGDVEAIRLENASASEVARVINALEQGHAAAAAPGGPGGGPPGGGGGGAARTTAVADDRTNTILLGGDKATRLRLRAIITHLDTPVDVVGNTRVVTLRHANAKKLVDVLGSMGQDYVKNTQKEKKPDVAAGIVNVQAYEGTNSLVITAPATLLKSMQDVIRRLDVRQAQVQVEAIIVEVSVKKAAELGIQWGILGSRGDSKGVLGGTSFSTANPSLIQLGGVVADGFTATTATALSGVSGLLVGGTNGDNFVGLLRALNSDTSNNVLSTPTVVTLDNEEAEIMVGSKISVTTGQTNTIQGGSPFTTTTRENVGLSLKVKPQISEGDVVRLDIQQEVSEVAATRDALGNRDTDTRTIKTAVLVDDQQILVLGGLIRSGRQLNNERVPGLSDLPLLGALFQAEGTSDEKRNLMVFLRPTILRTRDDGIQLTHEKYRVMRERQRNAPRGRGPLTLDEQTPLLPELGSGLRLERGLGKGAVNDPDGGTPLPRPATVWSEPLATPNDPSSPPRQPPPPKPVRARSSNY